MKETETEAALLRTAEEEFLEKGFENAKTMRIAEKAGVSHTMLHYYFRSKEQLFERVAEEKMKIFMDSLLPLVEHNDMPVLERVSKAVGVHFDTVMQNPLLPRFILMEMNREGSKVVEMLKDKINTYAAERWPHLQQNLDASAARGEIVKTSAINLIIDIACLNYFPFLVLPAVADMLNLDEEAKQRFLQQRKEESISTIRQRLISGT